MTNIEFAEIIAYITAAIGKPLTPDAQVVYFDLLGDLDAPVLQLAAKRVVLEHPWSTFPSVAELRAAAAYIVTGQVSPLTPAAAWQIAWNAIANIDPEIEGSTARMLERVPPLVAETIRAMGVPSLCYGREPVAVVRSQFLKAFEQLAARDKRAALLPPATRQAIEARAQPSAIVLALAEHTKAS